MCWKETRPGRFERPFDTLERLYRKIAANPILGTHQQQQYLISSVIKLNGKPSTRDLRQSWRILRHADPQIAAVADETSSQLVYKVPSPQDVEEWLCETFVEHATDDNATAECMDSLLPATSLVTLYYFPSSRELLFHTPHWRMDGIGLILLQSSFLKILSDDILEDPCFDGSEVVRLLPSLDEVANIPLDITEEMKAASATEMSPFTSGATPASITRVHEGVEVPGRARRISTRLPRDVTGQIIAASKRRGLKQTTVVQAALFSAIGPYMAPSDGALMGFNTYNLRGRLSVPWNGPEAATSVYHTGRPFSVELSTEDFEGFASSLKSDYEKDLQPMFGYMGCYVPMVESLLTAPYHLAINAPGAAHPELSSLGIIDNRLQSRYAGRNGVFEIEGWWLGTQILNPLLQTYLWTRAGDMHLACHYNEAFYDRKFVTTFLDEWKVCLIKELVN